MTSITSSEGIPELNTEDEEEEEAFEKEDGGEAADVGDVELDKGLEGSPDMRSSKDERRISESEREEKDSNVAQDKFALGRSTPVFTRTGQAFSAPGPRGLLDHLYY